MKRIGVRTRGGAVAFVVAAAALAAGFAAYLDPHVMVDLANRVWACF